MLPEQAMKKRDADEFIGDYEVRFKELEERLNNLEATEPPAAFLTSIAVIVDQKSSSVDGGSATSLTWNVRDLNTEVYDPDGIVSIASNQFTLAAGTYLVRWSCPAYRVEGHKSRLRNMTAGAVVQYGSSEFADRTAGENHTTRSLGTAVFTIASSSAFEIQHYTNTGLATEGLGVATNTEVEIYTIVEILKIG